MPFSERQHQLRFVVQVYRLRMLGCLIGLLPIASVLYTFHAPHWQWILALCNTALWPQLAYLRANLASNPVNAEQNNLVIDCFFWGGWMALIHFTLVPSATIISTVIMDRISAGGWPLLRRGLAWMMVCAILVWMLTGRPTADVARITNMRDVLACLPILLVYPVLISMLNFSLVKRVRKQNRMLRQLSRTDPLTQLPNRAHWLRVTKDELQRFHEEGQPVALLLLDIDHFKKVNDRYGHRMGDNLLVDLAELMRKQLRETDTPARIGGDEFAVTLPNTTLEQAKSMAETICREVEKLGTLGDAVWTLSLGIAVPQANIRDVTSWLEHADKALYRAKNTGRNRIDVALT